MKTRAYTNLIAVALALATASVSHAMSELVSLSTDPMWPTSSTPDNTLVYNVTTVNIPASAVFELPDGLCDIYEQEEIEHEDQ